jgi:beta-lactamase family protein
MVVPAQVALAGQRAAGPGTTVAPICHAWPHNGITRTKLAARLSSDIAAAVRGRVDTYSVRVRDPFLGIGCGLHATQHFYSASVIKATILAALLRKAHAQHRSLTAREKYLATLMITRSDNYAATVLWNDVGRTALQRFLDLAKMNQTVLGPDGYWGLSLLTAHDQTLLLWVLLKPNDVLTRSARLYELYLMAHVIASQRWGVPAGAPSGFTVHVKNGWAPLSPPFWNVNSIGCFTHLDKNYSIVVLTAGNPTEAYGITTIENVAIRVHHDLNPGLAAVVPRSTPNATWGIPDEPIPPASVVPAQ